MPELREYDENQMLPPYLLPHLRHIEERLCAMLRNLLDEHYDKMTLCVMQLKGQDLHQRAHHFSDCPPTRCKENEGMQRETLTVDADSNQGDDNQSKETSNMIEDVNGLGDDSGNVENQAFNDIPRGKEWSSNAEWSSKAEWVSTASRVSLSELLYESATSGMTSKDLEDVRTEQLRKISVLADTTQPWSDLIEVEGWWARMAFIVNREDFEWVVAVLVVMNSFLFGLEMQYEGLQVGHNLKYDGYTREADQIHPWAKITFFFADWFFGCLFCLEMLVKISIALHKYFVNLWNLVDFVCVAAFVVDKVASRFLPVSSRVLRLLRLFRLVRLARVIRKLENLETLYTMTTAIKGCFSILAWSLVLCNLILMTCALFLTQTLHSTYFSNAALGQWSTEERQNQIEMFEYFGTFSRCLFSMFELTFANWPPIARLLTEEVSEWFQLICVVHKIIMGVAVVGVINGVVLRETFKVADTDDTIMVRSKRREKVWIMQKAKNLFEALDLDHNGIIDLEEFLLVSANKEVQLWLNSLGIETDDLVALFRVLDKDSDGSVSIDELTARLPRIRGTARCADVIAMAADLTTQWKRHQQRRDTARSNSRVEFQL